MKTKKDTTPHHTTLHHTHTHTTATILATRATAHRARALPSARVAPQPGTTPGVACRSFYTHPPPTYTPHYPLQLPFTPPGSSQPIPYLEIPLEIPLAPGLVPMRGEVAAPPAIGPPRDKP